MSRKGNCWDNACSETLFVSLKWSGLAGQRFATIREAKDAVLEWLRWYDRSRMHSTLDYSSPAEYEQRWTEKQTQAAHEFQRQPKQAAEIWKSMKPISTLPPHDGYDEMS
jgi:hypothetical protein